MLTVEQSVEHRLTSLEEEMKSHNWRIKELYQRQTSMENIVSSIGLVAERQDNIEKDVTEMKGDIKTLLLKPSKNADKIWISIITAIIGGLVGYFFTKFGL